MNVKYKVNAILTNADMKFQINKDFLIVLRVTELVAPERLKISKQEFSEVRLVDENFDKPSTIDALLGAEIFMRY